MVCSPHAYRAIEMHRYRFTCIYERDLIAVRSVFFFSHARLGRDTTDVDLSKGRSGKQAA